MFQGFLKILESLREILLQMSEDRYKKSLEMLQEILRPFKSLPKILKHFFGIIIKIQQSF